jgi:hypothetical protein
MDGSPFSGLGPEGAPPPFRIPSFPIEWLDGQSWRLPSGKALAEFALRTGFLAPMLMNTAWCGTAPPKASKKAAARTVATRESR